jgi:iron complex outermembrane receptor protein
MHKSILLATSSVLAVSSVLTATAAFAQGAEIEQVVVSASRISIAGYQQPTPVSVIGAAALAEAANADIGDTLRQMPSMGASPTPEKGTSGNASNSQATGVSGVNLRNLGTNRNLVLFDGQRIVSPQLSGGVDLSVIPSSLVQRVDVVTAGASAAWGSDAVSGVINLIINKSFTGFKASIDGQDTESDLRRSYGFTATYGRDFDSGRLHLVGAITYNNSPSTVFQSSAHWFNRPCVMANPAYNAVTNPNVPLDVHFTNCGQNSVAGGSIISGPLAGIGWGPGGTVIPFTVGLNKFYNNSGVLTTSASSTVGGTPNQSNSAAQIGLLTFPLQQGTGFFYGSYKITPDIQAGLMLNYGWDKTHSSSLTVNTSVTVKTDNAYLDPTIAARMAALGVTSFSLQTNATDGVNLSNAGDINNFANALGTPVSQNVRQLYRAVFTLDGALGEDWSWNAALQHSESHQHEIDTHINITPNVQLAADAVRVTAGNVGASGLTVGSIVCRSTLSAPTNGCLPADFMGTGVLSPASLAYMSDNNDYSFINIEQDTADLSMQGKLPWDLLGAGVPSIAFGASYRKEAEVSTAGFNATNILLGGGNFQPSRGEYNVEEGFLEVDVPLIKNGIVQNLAASAAGRYTSYSLSGAVQTWKLGLTSQINDDVRARVTWSYDIRAPSLNDLFGGITASGGQIDYKTNTSVTSAFSNSTFNQNLQPEKSTTISGGLVLTPHWVPGLTMSADWYSINIKGIIATPSALITLTFCQQSVAFYCNNYIYNAPKTSANPNGLSVLNLVPTNNGFLQTSGLDFQADYSMDLLSGTLAWHLLGNYTDETTEAVFGAKPYDLAGSMGGDSLFTGVPKMHITESVNYSDGPWSGTVQARYIGSARINNSWTAGKQIDWNTVSSVTYLDLRGTYKWNDNVQFYASIDNTLDIPPPQTVGGGPGTNGGTSTNVSEYDTLGRIYHAGIRFTF